LAVDIASGRVAKTRFFSEKDKERTMLPQAKPGFHREKDV
jgi:hypothetical protein